jgi:hypothetical protein
MTIEFLLLQEKRRGEERRGEGRGEYLYSNCTLTKQMQHQDFVIIQQ